MFTPSPTRAPNFTGSARMPTTAREAISTTSSMGGVLAGSRRGLPPGSRDASVFRLGLVEYRCSAAADQRSAHRHLGHIPGRSDPCTEPEAASRYAAPEEQGCRVWKQTDAPKVDRERSWRTACRSPDRPH